MSKVRPQTFDPAAAAVARTAAGVTQQQAADAVGLTKANVQHWEAGRRQPYPEVTAKLAQLYGVPVEDLLISPLDLAIADLLTVRLAQRMTRDEIAERVGASTRTVELVESGARMPDDPVVWAAGYRLSLPALATAWRNTPTPDSDLDLAPRPVNPASLPAEPSAVTTALADTYQTDPVALHHSAPDLAGDDLGMVRLRARVSVEEMATRVAAPGARSTRVRDVYRVESATYLPPDPVRWAHGYGLTVRALAACWRRGWVGTRGGPGKHPNPGHDRAPGRGGPG